MKIKNIKEIKTHLLSKRKHCYTIIEGFKIRAILTGKKRKSESYDSNKKQRA